MDITIGFTEAERARIGSIYWEAFAKKIRLAFVDNKVGLRVAQAAMRPDRIFVARINGAVVVVCGFHEHGTGATGMSWKTLRSLLPFWQAARAALILSVIEKRKEPRKLVLDGICVDTSQRSRGIGTALLKVAERYAQDSNLDSVKLSVIDRNHRAEALYRRLGFEPVDSGSLGLLRHVYGFNRYTDMEKVLQYKKSIE